MALSCRCTARCRSTSFARAWCGVGRIGQIGQFPAFQIEAKSGESGGIWGRWRGGEGGESGEGAGSLRRAGGVLQFRGCDWILLSCDAAVTPVQYSQGWVHMVIQMDSVTEFMLN